MQFPDVPEAHPWPEILLEGQVTSCPIYVRVGARRNVMPDEPVGATDG